MSPHLLPPAHAEEWPLRHAAAAVVDRCCQSRRLALMLQLLLKLQHVGACVGVCAGERCSPSFCCCFLRLAAGCGDDLKTLQLCCWRIAGAGAAAPAAVGGAA